MYVLPTPPVAENVEDDERCSDMSQENKVTRVSNIRQRDIYTTAIKQTKMSNSHTTDVKHEHGQAGGNDNGSSQVVLTVGFMVAVLVVRAVYAVAVHGIGSVTIKDVLILGLVKKIWGFIEGMVWGSASGAAAWWWR